MFSLSMGPRRKAILALALLVPAPISGTLAALVLFPGTALGKGLFAASKLWLFAFPAVWLRLVDRERDTRQLGAGGIRLEVVRLPEVRGARRSPCCGDAVGSLLHPAPLHRAAGVLPAPRGRRRLDRRLRRRGRLVAHVRAVPLGLARLPEPRHRGPVRVRDRGGPVVRLALTRPLYSQVKARKGRECGA